MLFYEQRTRNHSTSQPHLPSQLSETITTDNVELLKRRLDGDDKTRQFIRSFIESAVFEPVKTLERTKQIVLFLLKCSSIEYGG